MASLDSIVLDPETSAVLVIDVQKDFAEDQGGFAYFDRQVREKRDDVSVIQRTVHEVIVPFLTYARESGTHILYIQSTYEQRKFPDMPRLCLAGSEGESFYEVSPDLTNPRQRIFRKHDHSSYESGNGLREYLDDRRIDTPVVVGGTADTCVSVAVFGSLPLGYSPVAVRDGIYTAGYKWKGARVEALARFEEHADIRVANAEQIRFVEKSRMVG